VYEGIQSARWFVDKILRLDDDDAYLFTVVEKQQKKPKNTKVMLYVIRYLKIHNLSNFLALHTVHLWDNQINQVGLLPCL